MKWHKFGITRTWDNLSIDIRIGKIKRSEAIEIIAKKGLEKPKEAILKFCNYLKISTNDFEKYCDKFRNKEVWQIRHDKWHIKDFIIKDWDWQKKIHN